MVTLLGKLQLEGLIMKFMNSITIRYLMALVLSCQPFVLFSQEFSMTDADTLLNKLRDESWEVRQQGFYSLVTFEREPGETFIAWKVRDEYQSPRVKEALYQLLVTELSRDKNFSEEPANYSTTQANYSEGYAEYVDVLMYTMGSIGEIRAIPYLITNMYNGAGITRALAQIGEPAVEPVIVKLGEGHAAAAQVLGEMLRPKQRGYIATGEIRDKIRQSLVVNLKKYGQPEKSETLQEKQIQSEYAQIRWMIVRAMGASQDKSFIPTLQEVLNTDSYAEIFLMKKAAKIALDTLESNR